MSAEHSLEEHFYGTATVGDRGQVVIPAAARKKYGVIPGDKMLVMGDPCGHGIMLCKIEKAREVLSSMLGEIERLESDSEGPGGGERLE